MRVLHTFQVQGESAETRDHRCLSCGFLSTSITVVLARPQLKRRGAAAMAVAQKMGAGEVVVVVTKKV